MDLLFGGVLWVHYSHPQIKHISKRVMLGRLLGCVRTAGVCYWKPGKRPSRQGNSIGKGSAA